MKLTPNAGRRRSTPRAASRSAGGPQTSSPTIRIAPKPSRLTSSSPPILNVPACAAFGFMRRSLGARPPPAPRGRGPLIGTGHAVAPGARRNLPGMNFDLSDEQRMLRNTVREFARYEVAPVAGELDRTKAFPYELVAKMGELGLMGIPFPEEYGGGAADTLTYALAVEELARVDSSVAITMAGHTSLGTM